MFQEDLDYVLYQGEHPEVVWNSWKDRCPRWKPWHVCWCGAFLQRETWLGGSRPTTSRTGTLWFKRKQIASVAGAMWPGRWLAMDSLYGIRSRWSLFQSRLCRQFGAQSGDVRLQKVRTISWSVGPCWQTCPMAKGWKLPLFISDGSSQERWRFFMMLVYQSFWGQTVKQLNFLFQPPPAPTVEFPPGKLTCRSWKRNFIFQPSIPRGYVGFRGE